MPTPDCSGAPVVPRPLLPGRGARASPLARPRGRGLGFWGTVGRKARKLELANQGFAQAKATPPQKNTFLRWAGRSPKTRARSNMAAYALSRRLALWPLRQQTHRLRKATLSQEGPRIPLLACRLLPLIGLARPLRAIAHLGCCMGGVSQSQPREGPVEQESRPGWARAKTTQQEALKTPP